MLEIVLLCWDVLIKAHTDLNRLAPLNGNNLMMCVKFYSVIQPVGAVQIEAQAMKIFFIVEVYTIFIAVNNNSRREQALDT